MALSHFAHLSAALGYGRVIPISYGREPNLVLRLYDSLLSPTSKHRAHSLDEILGIGDSIVANGLLGSVDIIPVAEIVAVIGVARPSGSPAGLLRVYGNHLVLSEMAAFVLSCAVRRNWPLARCDFDALIGFAVSEMASRNYENALALTRWLIVLDRRPSFLRQIKAWVSSEVSPISNPDGQLEQERELLRRLTIAQCDDEALTLTTLIGSMT